MHGREDAGGRAGRTRGGMTGRGPGARRAHRARPLSARGQLVRPRPSSPHGNSSRAGIVGRRLPSHGGGPPERLPHRPMCVLPSPTRGGRCVGREWHRGPSVPEAAALPGPSWRPSPGPRRPGLQGPARRLGSPGCGFQSHDRFRRVWRPDACDGNKASSVGNRDHGGRCPASRGLPSPRPRGAGATAIVLRGTKMHLAQNED